MAPRTDIEKLRETLLHRYRTLQTLLDAAAGQLSEHPVQASCDFADAAFRASETAVSAETADVVIREMAAIKDALERIRSGKYGICLRCGGRIAPARLRAMPAALHCVTCQAAKDLEDEAE